MKKLNEKENQYMQRLVQRSQIVNIMYNIPILRKLTVETGFVRE
jgi:hypothetical protein